MKDNKNDKSQPQNAGKLNQPSAQQGHKKATDTDVEKNKQSGAKRDEKNIKDSSPSHRK